MYQDKWGICAISGRYMSEICDLSSSSLHSRLKFEILELTLLLKGDIHQNLQESSYV